VGAWLPIGLARKLFPTPFSRRLLAVAQQPFRFISPGSRYAKINCRVGPIESFFCFPSKR
jgi:hypothetical protein